MADFINLAYGGNAVLATMIPVFIFREQDKVSLEYISYRHVTSFESCVVGFPRIISNFF